MKLIDFDPSKLDTKKISIGEKEELASMCEDFNRCYRETAWNPETSNYESVGDPIIGYTNKLIMKRGSYDRIKEAYSRSVLRFKVKNSDLYNLTNKIQDSHYYQQRFVRQLRSIQDKVWRMKANNLHNISDEAEIAPKMTILLNTILNNFDKMVKFIDKTKWIDNDPKKAHFKEYICNKHGLDDWDESEYFRTQHPTDISHIEWAEYLNNYIKKL